MSQNWGTVGMMLQRAPAGSRCDFCSVKDSDDTPIHTANWMGGSARRCDADACRKAMWFLVRLTIAPRGRDEVFHGGRRSRP